MKRLFAFLDDDLGLVYLEAIAGGAWVQESVTRALLAQQRRNEAKR